MPGNEVALLSKADQHHDQQHATRLHDPALPKWIMGSIQTPSQQRMVTVLCDFGTLNYLSQFYFNRRRSTSQ